MSRRTFTAMRLKITGVVAALLAGSFSVLLISAAGGCGPNDLIAHDLCDIRDSGIPDGSETGEVVPCGKPTIDCPDVPEC